MGIFSGFAKIGAGHKNRKMAAKMKNQGLRGIEKAFEGRTDFEIPEEIRKNQQLAENEAFGTPAVMRYMQEAAKREEASNVSAVNRYATSGADALAAISGVNQQSAARMNEAAMAGEQVRQGNMRTFMQANSQMADYKNMAWDMNVNIPFLQRLEFAQGLATAGYNGIIQGNNQIAQGGGEAADGITNALFSVFGAPSA